MANAVPIESQLTKAQIFEVCSEWARLKKEIPKSNPDGSISTARTRALEELAKKYHRSRLGLALILSGNISYARPYVAEWKAKANGDASYMPRYAGGLFLDEPAPPPELPPKAAQMTKLRAEGLSYAAISEKLGITESVVARFLHPGPLPKKKSTKGSRILSKPIGTNLSIDKFISAQEEIDRSAVLERHKQELAEVEERIAKRRDALAKFIEGPWKKI